MRKLERRLAVVVLGAIGANSATAGSMYTWRDGSGGVHYSNAPVTNQRPVRVEESDSPPAAIAPPGAAAIDATDDDGDTDRDDRSAQPVAAVGAPTLPSTDERERFSTAASARRRGLEKSFHAARERLTSIEGQLATLSRTKTQHAARGTNAGEAVADEERPLLTAKTAIERELAETRAAYGALAAEVTNRLGGLPDWWAALR